MYMMISHLKSNRKVIVKLITIEGVTKALELLTYKKSEEEW